MGRESKEPSSIQCKIVNREPEFIKLHGRRIYREESQKSRVSNNLRAKTFAELSCTMFVKKSEFFRAQKRCCKSRFCQEIYVRCLYKYVVWCIKFAKKKKKKQGKQFCIHSIHLYFSFLKKEYFLIIGVAKYSSRVLNKDPYEILVKSWRNGIKGNLWWINKEF